MKSLIYVALFFAYTNTNAQVKSTTKNIFIITTDGFRWQEVFKGADSALIRDTRFVKDTSILLQQFWDNDPEIRRRKLLPFFWTVIEQHGQLSGNRIFENDVNVANLYKISYPGYNEIFTGYPDKLFIPNLAIRNRNSNILEYLNTLDEFRGRVAAFSSWNVLPYILNEAGSNFPVNGGYEMLNETNDSVNALINQVQKNVIVKEHTRHDLLTFESAKNYIEQQHPRVLFLGLGETDEFAHKGAYDRYLQKAHQVDEMIAELWYYIQTDPFYKDNTTLIITTDHGRGNKPNNWNSHGFWIKKSGETWMAMLGQGIAPVGELKQKQQTYQKQIAATIAILLGEKFIPNHPVGKPITLLPVTNVDDHIGIVISNTGK